MKREEKKKRNTRSVALALNVENQKILFFTFFSLNNSLNLNMWIDALTNEIVTQYQRYDFLLILLILHDCW